MGSRIVLQRNAPRLALIPPPPCSLTPQAVLIMDIYQWVLGWWGPWGTAARWGVAALNEMKALPLAVAVAVGNLAT